MLENVIQVWLTITSAMAIYFVSRKDKTSKYGYVVGLLSQPAWFFTAIMNDQWGVLVLSIWYTFCWLQGIWNYWRKTGE